MSFTCPKCKAVSHNPNDERGRYCGRCHEFVGPAVPTRKCKQCSSYALLVHECTARGPSIRETLSEGLGGSRLDMPIKYFEWKCQSETCGFCFCITLEDLWPK